MNNAMTGLIAVPMHVRLQLLERRGTLFPWVPVFLGLGISIYFSLSFEPAPWVLGAVAVFGLVIFWVVLRVFGTFAPPLLCAGLLAVGFSLAGVRAHMMAGPVLDWRFYGAIEGRVVGIDRSASDVMRLTLDQVRLDRVRPHETPQRVRVALHGQQGYVTPRPNMIVMLTGHLSAPGGPVEPGGFDFRRHAWFLRLGAVGYTRSPVLTLQPAPSGWNVFGARMALSARIQAALPGEPGAFAAAVLTGDRSGMGQDTLRHLRHSNLAHLLAISGLHMGLLAGFVFAALRLIFALNPRVGLRWPVKKLSALGALCAAAGYLALSGGNVATERAFVMAAVALGAIMVDRRALSMRAVALAAVIVLILRPESLLGPGFQMSFAATTALVAVFAHLRTVERDFLPRWAKPVFAVVLSSAVAGLATAPIAAAHFNIFSNYGLVANLLSVPLMGLLVIPMGVLAILLMPFGLEAPALWVMGLGTRWILGVADRVANLDGAITPVVSPGAAVLPLIALGGLVVILWSGRARAIGALPVCAGFALWMTAERPHLLVAESGGLIGVMTEQGRALSKAKGAGFAAGIWLENDGDKADQFLAARRWGQAGDTGVLIPLTGQRVYHVSGKRALARFDNCAPGDVVVTNVVAEVALPCDVLDQKALRETGSLAIAADGSRVSARQITGQRLWSGAYQEWHRQGQGWAQKKKRGPNEPRFARTLASDG